MENAVEKWAGNTTESEKLFIAGRIFREVSKFEDVGKTLEEAKQLEEQALKCGVGSNKLLYVRILNLLGQTYY